MTGLYLLMFSLIIVFIAQCLIRYTIAISLLNVYIIWNERLIIIIMHTLTHHPIVLCGTRHNDWTHYLSIVDSHSSLSFMEIETSHLILWGNWMIMTEKIIFMLVARGKHYCSSFRIGFPNIWCGKFNNLLFHDYLKFITICTVLKPWIYFFYFTVKILPWIII